MRTADRRCRLGSSAPRPTHRVDALETRLCRGCQNGKPALVERREFGTDELTSRVAVGRRQRQASTGERVAFYPRDSDWRKRRPLVDHASTEPLGVAEDPAAIGGVHEAAHDVGVADLAPELLHHRSDDARDVGRGERASACRVVVVGGSARRGDGDIGARCGDAPVAAVADGVPVGRERTAYIGPIGHAVATCVQGGGGDGMTAKLGENGCEACERVEGLLIGALDPPAIPVRVDDDGAVIGCDIGLRV